MFDPKDPRNELYFNELPFKAFISSKMSGDPLKAERRAAIAAVEEYPQIRAWAWERDAPAGSYYSEEECERQAGTSQVLILILDREISRVTRAEYSAAYASGAHVVALITRDGKRNKELRRFIERLHKHSITKEFGDLGELSSEISNALWTWMMRATQTAVLASRKERAENADRALLESTEVIRGEETITLAELIDEARALVEKGSGEEAFEYLHELAAEAALEQHYALAGALLEELEDVVPSEKIGELERAWLDNVRGLFHSSTNRPLARSYFERVRQAGIAIGDRNLEATAHQNLGILAIHDGDENGARDHFIKGFELKGEVGDGYGSMQVALNMVDLLITVEKPDAARRILDMIRKPLSVPGLAGLRASWFAARGQLMTKKRNLTRARELFQESLRQARQAESAAREAAACQNLGSNAAEREEQREAIRWYRKALEKYQQIRDRLNERRGHSAIGHALATLEEWEPAAKQFAAAAQLAEELEDLEAEAEAWANVGACWSKAGSPEKALKLIEGALANPHANSDPPWRAHQLRNLAEVLNDLGQPRAAIKRLEEASNLVPEIEEKDSALARAAQIALARRYLAALAPPLLEKALALHDAGPKSEWAWRAATFGSMLNETSQAAKAEHFFTLALRVFARNGDRRRAFYVRNDRALGRANAGEQATAAADLRAALSIAEEIGDGRLQFQALLNLGEIERRRDRQASAEETEKRALGNARRRRDRADQAAVENLLGLQFTEQERWEEAEAAYSSALSIARQLKNPEILHGALGGLGGLAYRRGSYAQAEKRYRQALRAHGDALSSARAEDLGGLVLSCAARGRIDEDTLQTLVDLSGQIGWDHHCAPELSTAARVLEQAGGGLDEAISIQAAAIMCGFRSAHVRWSEDEDDEEGLNLTVMVTLEAVYWLQTREDYPELRQRLIEETDAGLDLEEDESIEFFIASAEEAIAELEPTSSVSPGDG